MDGLLSILRPMRNVTRRTTAFTHLDETITKPRPRDITFSRYPFARVSTRRSRVASTRRASGSCLTIGIPRFINIHSCNEVICIVY